MINRTAITTTALQEKEISRHIRVKQVKSKGAESIFKEPKKNNIINKRWVVGILRIIADIFRNYIS